MADLFPIPIGEKSMGFTWDGEYWACDKCGEKVPRGIVPISTHWNECIDEYKTLNALKQLFWDAKHNSRNQSLD